MKIVVLKPLGVGNYVIFSELQNDALMHREGLKGQANDALMHREGLKGQAFNFQSPRHLHRPNYHIFSVFTIQ